MAKAGYIFSTIFAVFCVILREKYFLDQSYMDSNEYSTHFTSAEIDIKNIFCTNLYTTGCPMQVIKINDDSSCLQSTL
jgi:hypothetical protein